MFFCQYLCFCTSKASKLRTSDTKSIFFKTNPSLHAPGVEVSERVSERERERERERASERASERVRDRKSERASEREERATYPHPHKYKLRTLERAALR
jgi:hypothetical protein